MKAALSIRPARIDDAAALLEIYKPYIERTAITFEEEVPSVESFATRIANCLQRYPWIVCVVDGAVAGYAYAATYNERAAYQWACLSSVYLAEEFKGRGIAKPLYETLFDLLRQQGFLSVFALITLPNEPSVRLHEKCGFKPFTTFDHIGFKLGQWQEVGWWRFDLDAFPEHPAPPVPFPQFDAALAGTIYGAGTTKIQAAFEKEHRSNG